MTLNIPELTVTWKRLDAVAHDAIVPITDEAAYERALLVLEDLLAEVGEDGAHPLGDLVRGLVERVTTYQRVAGHVPRPSPAMELRLLMQERGLTQQQLARDSGIEQGQISRLLSGKRPFTLGHIRRISAALGVQPEVFLS